MLWPVWVDIGLWGFIATMLLTALLHACQGLGFSRLSLPFLLGTMMTGDRDRAYVIGALLYLAGGWILAFGYAIIFTALGQSSWWLGALVGAGHGLMVLLILFPILSHVHPRMATEYDGPTHLRMLEPPGFLALNYGYRTPLTVIVAHILFGAVLGAGLSLP
ncbi:MAG: hypothetical protein D6690_12535 [Nitrospirae bacterium]|nr:MAG: hypothetical protein D6690_12535 [Nitrospirota bacterium]